MCTILVWYNRRKSSPIIALSAKAPGWSLGFAVQRGTPCQKGTRGRREYECWVKFNRRICNTTTFSQLEKNIYLKCHFCAFFWVVLGRNCRNVTGVFPTYVFAPVLHGDNTPVCRLSETKHNWRPVCPCHAPTHWLCRTSGCQCWEGEKRAIKKWQWKLKYAWYPEESWKTGLLWLQLFCFLTQITQEVCVLHKTEALFSGVTQSLAGRVSAPETGCLAAEVHRCACVVFFFLTAYESEKHF